MLKTELNNQRKQQVLKGILPALSNSKRDSKEQEEIDYG